MSKLLDAYLKYKMMAVSASRQDWGFDTHMNWKEWWCLNIILLEVSLLFWKLFIFQELSCTFKKRKLNTAIKTERASFPC